MGHVATSRGLQHNGHAVLTMQLRVAMPELFNVDALLEGVRAVVRDARDRAAGVVAAVARIGPDAGWSADDVAGLKVHVDGVVDGLTRVIDVKSVKLDVTDTVDCPDARGPAWTKHTVTLKVGNVEELVAAAEPYANELERLHAFGREVEEQRADVHRVELKLRDAERHLVELEGEQKQLDTEGASDPDGGRPKSGARRDRLVQQVEHAKEKVEHRRKQLKGHRERLGDMLDVFVTDRTSSKEPATAEPCSALLEAIRAALSVERRDHYVARDVELEARLEREAADRDRRARRRALVQRVAVGAGVVVLAAWVRLIVADREEAAAPISTSAVRPFDDVKTTVLNHAFLKPRLTDGEARAIGAAYDMNTLRDAVELATDRMVRDREPHVKDLQRLTSTWSIGIDITETAPRTYRVDFHKDAAVEAVHELFGLGAKLDVTLGRVGEDKSSSRPLPIVLSDEVLCAKGTSLVMQLTIPIPFVAPVLADDDLLLYEIAWERGCCSKLPANFRAGVHGD